jgi:molecular chaperone GrpE
MKNDHTPPNTPEFPAETDAAPGDNASGNASTSVEGAAELEAQIEQLKADAAQWQDKYLRKLAEFDNYRKRTRSETESLRQYITESLIVSLLPIMDDFERALSHVEDSDNPLRKGIDMVREKLRVFFDANGAVQFDCIGKPFNPDEHDALMMKPTPDFPAGTVLNVITPGYRMGERVIRHAQVVVSAEAESGSENTAATPVYDNGD